MEQLAAVDSLYMTQLLVSFISIGLLMTVVTFGIWHVYHKVFGVKQVKDGMYKEAAKQAAREPVNTSSMATIPAAKSFHELCVFHGDF